MKTKQQIITVAAAGRPGQFLPFERDELVAALQSQQPANPTTTELLAGVANAGAGLVNVQREQLLAAITMEEPADDDAT